MCLTPAGPKGASAWVFEPAQRGVDVSRQGVGCGLASADFERALSVRPCARTQHFALHYLPPGGKLSTAGDVPSPSNVDDCTRSFGLVVPKRHARRAVTRSLIKRQGRSGWSRHALELRCGSWLLRLRCAFATAHFRSAVSGALRLDVGAELDALFKAASGVRS